jgi:hypothetical protein
MTAPARKIRDAHDANACLDAVAASGLSLKAWANAHGVNGRSLNAWALNLGRLRSSPLTAPLRLVEVVPVQSAASVPDFRLHVDDLVVDVPAAFDADALGRLVAVLRRC